MTLNQCHFSIRQFSSECPSCMLSLFIELMLHLYLESTLPEKKQSLKRDYNSPKWDEYINLILTKV